MIIPEDQVTTSEVKGWTGLTLLNFQGSTCSQKVRIMLGLKGISYTNRQVNLVKHENTTAWYLGINPRGVVPVLVHDGVVHVESNDILEYVDQLPSDVDSFFPKDEAERKLVKESLDLEGSLHEDLRNLTMKFMVPGKLVMKDETTLKRWEEQGADNPSRLHEVKWWRDFARQGVTDQAARVSLEKYRNAFETLETWLSNRPYLMGDRLSALDITWYISANRLKFAGYPLDRHPRLSAWFDSLDQNPLIAREVNPPLPLRLVAGLYGTWQKATGKSMNHIEQAA